METLICCTMGDAVALDARLLPDAAQSVLNYHSVNMTNATWAWDIAGFLQLYYGRQGVHIPHRYPTHTLDRYYFSGADEFNHFTRHVD
jgi:hypothetical protein